MRRRAGARAGRLAAKLGLAALSLVLGLLAAEALVRLWLPQPSSMYRTDPVLIHVLVPGARGLKSVGSGSARVRVATEINSQGYRGPELILPRRGPRIAVYGDSFVLAEDVALEQTFVARLGAELGPPGAIEMVNAGVVGYGPDQACLRMERELAGLAPDLVVLVLCATNDFGDLVRNKLFALDGNGNAVQNRITLAPELLRDFEARARAARRPALLRLLDSRGAETGDSPGRGLPYLEWYFAAAREEYLEYVERRDLAVRTVWQDYYDVDVAIHPEWPSADLKRRLMRAVLARMQSALALRGIPLVALVVPSAVDVFPGNEIQVDPERFPEWSPARLCETLDGILRDLGLAFVDLYTPFREAGAERLYFGAGNMHWNAAGQELAARSMAGFLRERGLWPPAR